MLENDLGNIRKELDCLTTVDTEKALTLSQENLFMELIRHKESNSQSGLIPAYNIRGRAKYFVNVRKAEVGSNSASASTIRSRSSAVEKIASVSSSAPNSDADAKRADRVTQKTSFVKRSQPEYVEVVQNAGVKLVGKFRNETVLSLKSEMPFALWRAIKRAFKVETGIDIMGSEKPLREDLKELEYEYECGTFETTPNDQGQSFKINFVRVVDVKEVIHKMVTDLLRAGKLCRPANIPSGELIFLLTGDKGGSTTKLFLQTLNTKNVHSHKTRENISELLSSHYMINLIPFMVQLLMISSVKVLIIPVLNQEMQNPKCVSHM